MQTVHPSRLLKVALLADAVVSGAMGVLQLGAAAALATLLELPQALLLTGTLAPSALGTGFVLMQAVAVVLFAGLEWRGLRNSAPAGQAAWTVLS